MLSRNPFDCFSVKLALLKSLAHTAGGKERNMANREKVQSIKYLKVHFDKLSLFSLTTHGRNWFLNFPFLLNGN